MPRRRDSENRPHVQDNARGRLWSRMADAVRQGRRNDVGHLVNLLGGRGRGGGTGKLADQISAQTGENRKSVMKRIQRALGRQDRGEPPPKTPVDKGTGVVDQQLRGNAAGLVRSGHGTGGPATVSMKVWITVSQETNPTERTARATLRGGRQEEFAAAIENGSYEDAANIVFSAYWGESAEEVEIHDFGEIQF